MTKKNIYTIDGEELQPISVAGHMVDGDTPIYHVMLDSLEKAFWELRGYTGRTVTVVL